MPTNNTSSSASSQEAGSDSKSDAPLTVIGQNIAKLTIIEYGDFKCPLCNRFFHQTEPQLRRDYIDSGKVKLEFRALSLIADDSTAAAAAAICAADAGKFTQYHDLLFSSIGNDFYNRNDFSIEEGDYFNSVRLKQLGSSLALGQKFNDCVDSGKYLGRVSKVTSSAKAAGYNSTPIFVIGSQVVKGAQPYSVLKAVIDSQLP